MTESESRAATLAFHSVNIKKQKKTAAALTSEQLSQNAAEAPHVDLHAVLSAQDDFRCTVESGLNVSINPLMFVATGAEVNHLDARTSLLLQRAKKQKQAGGKSSSSLSAKSA